MQLRHSENKSIVCLPTSSSAILTTAVSPLPAAITIRPVGLVRPSVNCSGSLPSTSSSSMIRIVKHSTLDVSELLVMDDPALKVRSASGEVNGV